MAGLLRFSLRMKFLADAGQDTGRETSIQPEQACHPLIFTRKE